MQIKQFIRAGLILGLSVITMNAVFAQKARTKKTRASNGYGNAYGNTSGNGYGNAYGDTTKKKAVTSNTSSGYGGSNYGNTSASTTTSFDSTLPITVMPSSGGLLDSTKYSLRNDAPFEQNLVKDRVVLPYEDLREDDAAYRVRVWREIDTREKINLPFRYAGVEDNGNQRFISILLSAIKDSTSGITAFSAEDDRFTTPITSADAEKAFGGGSDTVKEYDLDGNLKGYQVRAKAVEPDSIYLFRVKEEWIFDKKTSRMFARILGIAPVISQKLSTGETIPNSEHPVWWVYYPDIRPVLAKYMAYNPKNMGARMTWEELFENRMFGSYITRSSIDNPYDAPLKQYIDDPMFRLYAGDAIKEKIFNYEQSLWSY